MFIAWNAGSVPRSSEPRTAALRNVRRMRDLPTGTVTFLFTDIEGSTGLLQDLGRDEFVRLLDRHAEILRTAVAEQGVCRGPYRGRLVLRCLPDGVGRYARRRGGATSARRAPLARRQPDPRPHGTAHRRGRSGRRRLDRFPDGVFFVDLSPLTDPTLVISEIAGVLKVREAPHLDLAASLRRHLADLDVMLVLDNFEQLVDGSSVIGDLLDAAPGLTVLATSRIALRLSGEYEYQVAPLELPARERRGDAAQLVTSESVRLFVDRATSVRPDFTLTDANASAVAEIVERLDGLPLALELAASRLRVLDPTALSQRLEDRLSMLRGGARDLPERHRTLDGTIRWSHEMLQPDEQRLFARLSVFVGGWTLDAAEAVCGGDDIDVLEGLGTLVDDSLVRRRELAERSLRFWMLETIREFAWERLEEAGEVRTLRERHGRHHKSPRRAGQPRARWPARQLAGAVGRGAGESPSRSVLVPRPIRLRGFAGDRGLARPLLAGPRSPQ